MNRARKKYISVRRPHPAARQVIQIRFGNGGKPPASKEYLIALPHARLHRRLQPAPASKPILYLSKRRKKKRKKVV
jgi:hypothetical protein